MIDTFGLGEWGGIRSPGNVGDVDNGSSEMTTKESGSVVGLNEGRVTLLERRLTRRVAS